jgi:peptidoglycan/LPS O-acetylase OafA/YrhL
VSPVSVLPVLFSLLVALALLFFLTGVFKKQLQPVRFLAIDGLRGYLAFFVFLHHASIYYFAFHTYIWQLPPSNLYSHFGGTSVCLFFMITSFLFFTRLIDYYNKRMDWLKFFVARVLRLYPLYLIALALCFLYAGIDSNFVLLEPVKQIATEAGHWLLFSIFGQPNINGIADTQSYMVSVLWSLKYEWLFYLLLPSFALIFFRSGASVLTMIITLGISLLIILFAYPVVFTLFIFSGGIVAAFAARNEAFSRGARHWFSSIIIILCLIATVVCFNTVSTALPLIILSVAFIGIACGNSFFGLLTFRLSRELGQLSYGIYLLHSLILYALFHFCFDREQVVALSALQYWLIVSGAGGVLIMVCFFLHHYIELPAIRATTTITALLRKGFYRQNAVEISTIKSDGPEKPML